MDYQALLNRHLARYKQAVLGIRQPGIFKYRGRDVPKDHILPLRFCWENLLPPARSMVKAFCATRGRLKLHQYFHHLNSSQAFAFNLFFPYFEGGEQASAALLRALGVQQAGLVSWEPEAVPDEDEGTNLDMRCVLSSGEVVLCEVKLSERDFGKASNDAKHRSKLQDTYRLLLASHVAHRLLTQEAFFGAYQILRNIWHLVSEPKSCLLFLLPRANEPLCHELESILRQVCPETRTRITSVAIEDVLRTLQVDPGCPSELREYAGQLEAKYVPAACSQGAAAGGASDAPSERRRGRRYY